MSQPGTTNWQQTLQRYPDKYPHHLAQRFPHILQKLSESWGNPERARSCFSDLLTTQRENRAGFPAEIYTEIFALSQLYDQLNTPPKNAADSYWNWVAG